MDEELHRYVLHLSCLPDSPPGVRPGSPPDDVSWSDYHLELSHFSSDSAVVDLTMPQPKRKLTNYCAPVPAVTRKWKAAICISPKKIAYWDFYLFVIFFYLFARFSQFTSNKLYVHIYVYAYTYTHTQAHTHTGTHTYKHTHTAQQDTTSNIQFICRNYCIDMSHPILRLVLPHWCWQLTLVTFQWPNSWWRRTTVMWMRRIVMWVDGKQWEECLTAQLVLVPVVTNRLRELEHKMHNTFKWSQTQYWQFTEVVLCCKCSSVTLHSIVE